jgi:arylsulfatase A-like enzyme
VAPHPPLVPPGCYFDIYNNRELEKPKVGSWAEEIGRNSPYHPDIDCFEGRLGDDDIKRMMAGYYGLITHLDHQIGRLIRALKDEGVLDNTVILFTSDHGEMLGDHNMFRKSQAFEGSVSVPMVLFDPGNALNLTRGKHLSPLAELRDVMPTLLDAAGLTVPESVEGESLLHSINCKAPWREYLHGEHTSQLGGFSTQYIVTQNEKYIWFSHTGKEMLFDLKNDPYEMNNLSALPEYSEKLENLRSILVKELSCREEGYSDGKCLYSGKIPKTILE